MPDTWGFTRNTAEKLVTLVNEPATLARPRTQRSRQPRIVSGMLLAKTPVGGIPAATGTGPYTFGSATCTIVNDDGTVGSDTLVVKNIVTQAISANVVIKVARVGEIWVVDTASC